MSTTTPEPNRSPNLPPNEVEPVDTGEHAPGEVDPNGPDAPELPTPNESDENDVDDDGEQKGKKVKR